MLGGFIRYILENRWLALLALMVFTGWGLVTAPFGWEIDPLPADPVPVDAIPDLGENQQIVFTSWEGHSPRDIEDQISYPLTTYLLGVPGVRTVRSSSIFGFSSVYLIFDEAADFYDARSRILEKIAALPADLLPAGVRPALGPDATALGQVFWYTLEGRDRDGNPTGGWDLHEIRAVQDFYVKYALTAADGVSEVASIGGFVQEYQVDVDPDAMKNFGVTLDAIVRAVRRANRDVGAKTLEINQAEYFVRGLGYIKRIEDLEQAAVAERDNVPILVRDVARVSLGPATRRGALDKGGAEVVGGVVVARFGANPLAVIESVKAKIAELSTGLPKKLLPNGVESQLTVVPFYDRSQLIYETLGTLETALSLEMLITLLVVIVLVQNLRASVLIAGLLPFAVLIVFIAMRYTGVDANIVALSGIAIAIGTMVDLGVILIENILKHLDEAPADQSRLETIYRGTIEVSAALLTAVATTLVSFLPVFTLQAAEGKLFIPLAFTKSYALTAALLLTLLVIPVLAFYFLGKSRQVGWRQYVGAAIALAIGLAAFFIGQFWVGILVLLMGLLAGAKQFVAQKNVSISRSLARALDTAPRWLAVIGVVGLLATYWLPLGASRSWLANAVFVGFCVGAILGFFALLECYYAPILRWCLKHKVRFLLIPALLILLAVNIWLGFAPVFGGVARGFDALGVNLRTTGVWTALTHTFPGLGTEFMPALDEGSFLLMPTSMPHSGVAYNREVLAQLDMRVAQIPEVDMVVGKMGRAATALDPAPISMFENVINYRPEYAPDAKGRRQRFRVDDANRFVTVSGDTLSQAAALAVGLDPGDLIPDPNGRFYRNWRPHIESPDDIWNEIIAATQIPGVTSAPKLQPIETRLVMLQTGMRAPMGIKVYGPDLATIEAFGVKLGQILETVPSVKSEAVFADRIVGKPYLHLKVDRAAIARYGLNVEGVLETVETAIGGRQVTTTVEGRARYAVRVRYPRELRDDPASLRNILVSTPGGEYVPLGQLVELAYVRGPQAIKSEETFLVGYVLFDKRSDLSAGEVVRDARAAIAARVETGSLLVPEGVTFKFSGSYENQIRAEKRLSVVVPIVLAIVLLILYLQFRSVSTAFMVFTGVALAFSGGFLLLWLYGRSGFIDLSVFGIDLRELFQVETINLSVAVWVGFIALFGIATDDGVLMATYLDQQFKRARPTDRAELREAVVTAGQRRIKPAVTTSATTLIALLPILTSTGRGSDIMIPMAIPAFGGMLVAAISYFVVPVLYAWREERNLKPSST